LGSTSDADIFWLMDQQFAPGDYLIFQLESGFGLLRVIAIDEHEGRTTWHLLAYEELFPSIEAAEQSIAAPASLHVRQAHMALTNRAFERTPAARLGNREINDQERAEYDKWLQSDQQISDRSALLMLGLR
jgi:hypothetical protein